MESGEEKQKSCLISSQARLWRECCLTDIETDAAISDSILSRQTDAAQTPNDNVMTNISACVDHRDRDYNMSTDEEIQSYTSQNRQSAGRSLSATKYTVKSMNMAMSRNAIKPHRQRNTQQHRQQRAQRLANLQSEKDRLLQLRSVYTQQICAMSNSGKQLAINRQPVEIPSQEGLTALQARRQASMKAIIAAYNERQILTTIDYLCKDAFMSGTHATSATLRGNDALLLDYISSSALFKEIHLACDAILPESLTSHYFQVNWTFSGTIVGSGIGYSQNLTRLMHMAKHKRIQIKGVYRIMFSGEKIAYIHPTANNSGLLAALAS